MASERIYTTIKIGTDMKRINRIQRAMRSCDEGRHISLPHLFGNWRDAE
jgi:hypothetical protein